jgi:hypothetical protein
VLQSITNRLAFYENVFGRGVLAANGKNFSVRCPICDPKDPNKRKLAIRVEDDLNHCWTCGWKAHTLAPLIRKYGSQDHLNRYRDEFMPSEAKGRFSDSSNVEPEKKKLELPKDFRLLTLASLNDPDVKAAWIYLSKRNVTLRDAWFYKLGISNDYRWKRRVIIPSFDAEGSLNYFVGRSVDEFDKRPKYDNPEDDKLPVVFNEININWSDRLVICEGPFDLMKCGENAVPLLGSDLNEQSRLFTQILVHGTPVALALDGDMWHKKTPKIAKKLQSYNIDVIVVDTREAGDPGKMSKQQFKEALLSASIPNWENSFFDRLDRMSEIKLKIKNDDERTFQPRTAKRSHY